VMLCHYFTKVKRLPRRDPFARGVKCVRPLRERLEKS
jgi:hypothetical protein